MSRSLTGRCECGAVEYEVADEFRYALNCACPSARSAPLRFPPRGVRAARAVSGGPRRAAPAHVGRGGERNDDGSLRDEPSLQPTAHIYVGSKAPWFEITDNLPQHEEVG